MKERNYGIDFLRIFSMLMVAMLHILLQGGILGNTRPLSGQYWIAWYLEIFSYCAVNCFALISGYVMWRSTLKIAKMMELWLQTAFYTVSITAIMFLIYPDTRSWSNVINAIFPITREQYWYISAYFGMCLLTPVLNMGLRHLSKNMLGALLLIILLAMSILPTALDSDPYALSGNYSMGGYSMLWLCLLYLLGGYMARYELFKTMSSRRAFLYFLAAVTLTFLVKMLVEYSTSALYGTPLSGNILVEYTSPSIIASGFFLTLACAKLSCGPLARKLIALFAPAALGVYIIHAQPLVWDKVMKDIAISVLDWNAIVMGIMAVCCAFTLWFVCSCIELGRIRLFALLGVKDICRRLESRLLAAPLVLRLFPPPSPETEKDGH